MRVYKWLILITSSFLTSCSAYQNTSVALSDAVNKGPVKVVFDNKESSNYDRIILFDGSYYGIKTSDFEPHKKESNYYVLLAPKLYFSTKEFTNGNVVLLDKDRIQVYYKKKKTKAQRIRRAIIIPIAIIGGVFAILFAIEYATFGG